jgi:hypothetical protein
MSSLPESNRRVSISSAARWNARLHYYLGLYFLFFIWLFALTGLLLNHGMWGFAELQRSRETSKSAQRVAVPKTGTPLGDARELMRQLEIVGEVQWSATPGDANRFDFRVVRPGLQTDVKVDLGQAMATIERTTTSTWAIARNLHVFTGVRMNDPRNDRDWILTKAWAYSMDAVAAGLLLMVASGVWIWLQAGTRKWPGLIALGAGVLICAWFVAGVAWLGS